MAFVKGHSGNPRGRPKDAPGKVDLVRQIHLQLSSVNPETQKTRAEDLSRPWSPAAVEAMCGLRVS